MDQPVMMPLQPSEEEQMLRDAVRGIASNYGREYMRECVENERPAVELWDELAKGGYLGVNLPTEYGGGGMGMTGLAAVQETLAECQNTLLLLVVSPAITGSILARHGTEEQKKEWLPGLAAGERRVAFAVTEPDAGSNTHRISTNAHRTDRGTWRLNGQKYYISGVEHAHDILVVARNRMPDGTLGLPLLFLVPVDAPGVERQHLPTAVPAPDWQWTLYFDDVEVSDDRLVAGDQGGLAALFDGLNPERIMGAASAIGGTKAGLDKAVSYATTRKVWRDQPIGTHQAIAHPLAEIWIQYEQARLMLRKACALYDAGHPDAGSAANVAKFTGGDVAVRAADQAIQTHGGNGLSVEYGLTDMWLSARLAQIAPVSREMVLNHVAQHTLGLPKSY